VRFTEPGRRLLVHAQVGFTPDLLVSLHPDDIAPRQVYAATPSGTTLSPAANAFLSLITTF
jgi:DNA-binding transcriptional LysR family regulator